MVVKSKQGKARRILHKSKGIREYLWTNNVPVSNGLTFLHAADELPLGLYVWIDAWWPVVTVEAAPMTPALGRFGCWSAGVRTDTEYRGDFDLQTVSFD